MKAIQAFVERIHLGDPAYDEDGKLDWRYDMSKEPRTKLTLMIAPPPTHKEFVEMREFLKKLTTMDPALRRQLLVTLAGEDA